MRNDGRKNDQLRLVHIVPEVLRHAEGSAEIRMGNTRVICTASFETSVPKWMAGSGKGWITAEYGMLPRSTHTRIRRDKAATSGRTQEISRLIGRSLRAAVDLSAMPDKQITIDCDVIEADGGTRTASITGGFVALALAIRYGLEQGLISQNPLRRMVSAVSLGLHENQIYLDLNYEEDFACEVDMNIVMASHGEFVEIQGTAESGTFHRESLNKMLDLAQMGCQELFVKQKEICGEILA